MPMAHILVVEDEARLARSIIRTLIESEYSADTASNLTEATRLLTSGVDLVVLDLMLPDGSGLDWLAEVRATNSRIPVLILTARDAISDRVAGLDAGADDYLVKPFALDELLARIRALLRREARPVSNRLTVGSLEVDLLARTASRDGCRLELQNRQLELLIFLMRHVNEVVSREMIAKEVWKESTATWTNVIEVHVTQLRKQLEGSGRPPILHTIRGRGYLLGDAP
jgi:two-component system copper resistance phosphate regulon response regulator CusR